MNILNNLRVAFRSLTANMLRSVLTILGIVIGVAAVVALLSIGKGATQSVTSRVENLGSNLISVSTRRSFQPGVVGDTSATLLYSDYQAILANVTNVRAIAPVYSSGAQVIYQDKTSNYQVTGINEDYLTVYSYTVASGRPLLASDNESQSKVVVIGSQVATDMFSGLNPLGRSLTIDKVKFEVIGVLASKGSSGFGSGDDVVLIPLQTGYTYLFGSRARLNGKATLSSISMSAADANSVNTVISEVETVLRGQHGLGLNDTLPFSVSSQAQALSTLNQVTSTLTAFLGAIAAISLIVGGIGIMNISLVSVTERTREIGLRKAVGAPRRAILVQFLIETMTLAIIGGVFGVLLGVGIAMIVSISGVIQASITWDTITLAFTSAALVGLFFGIYPAYQASKKSPIEALRYE
ncbi:MAG: ABC transporter permease [Anaerolineaceae bacterium]|jgi:putative ABC transport system permease protein